jgi:hypothetical protein
MTVFEVVGTVVLGVVCLAIFASLQLIFGELARDIRSTCEVPSDLVGVKRNLYIRRFKRNRRSRIICSSICSAIVGFLDLLFIFSILVLIFFN